MWKDPVLSGSPFPPCVAELPGAPTNLGISNIGPRSVTLQFKPGYDGKTSISRWLVEAQVNPDARGPAAHAVCSLGLGHTPVLESQPHVCWGFKYAAVR